MPLVRYLEEIEIGERVAFAKTITEADAALFSAATGDFGPVHFDEDYAAGTRFGKRLAPGMLIAGISTSVLTTRLIGILGVSIEDRFRFPGPVGYGDTVAFEVWISGRNLDERTVGWRACARKKDGTEVLQAEATVKFPRTAVRRRPDDSAGG